MINLKKAAEIQQRLSSRVKLHWDNREISFLGGADCGYNTARTRIAAVIVVFKMPEFKIVDLSKVVREVSFPYIPGFLNFREGPAFLEAFKKIRIKPGVLLVDGNGIAHPRKMGLASYMGVLLDACTIGCAKKPFFPYKLPGENKGDYTFFTNKDEKVGLCLRTREKVKPIFVSPGHKIDFTGAMNLVLDCTTYRIPEPLRQAHDIARMIF